MPGRTPKYQQFFAELKRRHVFRVMAVYGIVGFVILQIADLAIPALLLPEWTYRLVAFLLFVGFPVAVVIAWAFEITPDGIRKTEAADPAQIEAIVAQPASRRWPAGLLALAGAALLFGGWWLGQRGGEAGLSLAPAGVEAADFQTIAVLPFEDLGGNEEDDPLLLGFHVAVIDRLTKLGDLRVTQPASVDGYANSTKETRQIAAELADVDHLVRGSVGRSGSRARITVLLVDLATNETQSIEDWTGEVTVENLFQVQSRIALAVARELEARLSPQDIERLETGLSTTHPEAINAYHRARRALFLPREVGIDEVVAHLERAVELAPEFVEAWSSMARVMSDRSRGLRELSGRALQAVERTETLAPGSLEAIKARGWYTYYVESDFERALKLMREAERMAPSDADVLQGIAWLQHRLGQFADGNRTMKRAAELDPQNPGTLWDLAEVLGRVTKWDAADEVLERALAIDPSNTRVQYSKVWLIVTRDRDPERARRLVAEMGWDDPEFWSLTSRLAMLERDYDAAARILADVPYDETSIGARIDRLWVLVRSVLVEQLRDGDPGPFLDSLRALLGPDSAVVGFNRIPQAKARLLIGEEEAGMALLAEIVTEARSSDDHVRRTNHGWWVARTHAQFGRTEEALTLLDEAVAKPSDWWWSAADLLLDPRFDALRGDPRFDALVARQEAYEAEQAREAEAEGSWLP